MLTHKHILILSALSLAVTSALAGVSAEEAKKLGTTLTPVGAEVAGNADKSIPAYTGGLTKAPAGYEKGSGIRPDPFASEKPLYSITSANMAQHESKLTAGTRELLKRYPTMRVDVYPTHRSAGYPKSVLDNSIKNATSVKTTDGGLGVEGTYAGIPFPIPKTGHEAMWNHLLRYMGHSYITKYDSINVNSSGNAVLATSGEMAVEYPYYAPNRTSQSAAKDIYFRVKIAYTAPTRRAGEALLVQDYINVLEFPRKAWQYLPGQRRVRMSPELGYDTPNAATAGTSTYDDSYVFSGGLDRFDWKLVGKREMLVPYNTYKLSYAKDPYAVTTPSHLNPDYMRWELHRVWVVEATLKEGKRHIYAKRTFYLDEDSWFALASDQYDSRGQLYRAGFTALMPFYELPAPGAAAQFFYDFATGSYNVIGLLGAHSTGLKFVEPSPERHWTSDALAGAGVR
jgi:Protein of unknown function (DUF1329)